MAGHRATIPEKGGQQITPKDFIVEPITLRKGLVGAKPEKVCRWILDLLNFQQGDEIVDLYPGTGVMTRVAIDIRHIPEYTPDMPAKSYTPTKQRHAVPPPKKLGTSSKSVKPPKMQSHRPPAKHPAKHDPAPKKSDAFPLVSTLRRTDMDRVIEIMKDDLDYAEQIAALKEARDGMKTELVEIGERNDVAGLRWGPYAVYIRGMKTTKTFSAEKAKAKIVEAGLPAELLDDCYTESDPWADVRVVDTSKPVSRKTHVQGEG